MQIQKYSPNYGGTRSQTLGCVLHSTRGGASTPEAEFKATLNWFANPNNQVSAHVVIGPTGVIAWVVDDRLECWGAREYNATHVQIECVQPTPLDCFTEEQYQATAWVVKRWAVEYGFPLDRAHIQGHDEIPPGVREGKTDPGKMWDWGKFMRLLG